jgi:hypothetical protein
MLIEETKVMSQRMSIKFSVAIAVVAVSLVSMIATTGASASEFAFSTFPAKLSGEGTTTQVFKASEGSSAVECEKLLASGEVTKEGGEEQDITMYYSGCEAFGERATVTEASYEFDANGSVSVLRTITIDVPELDCTITMSPQVGLKTVTYKNDGNDLLIQANVKGNDIKGFNGITDTVAGGGKHEECGKDGTNTDGTYVGDVKVELLGGSIAGGVQEEEG